MLPEWFVTNFWRLCPILTLLGGVGLLIDHFAVYGLMFHPGNHGIAGIALTIAGLGLMLWRHIKKVKAG